MNGVIRFFAALIAPALLLSLALWSVDSDPARAIAAALLVIPSMAVGLLVAYWPYGRAWSVRFERDPGRTVPADPGRFVILIAREGR